MSHSPTFSLAKWALLAAIRSIIGVICSWRLRGKPSLSQRFALNAWLRCATCFGRPEQRKSNKRMRDCSIIYRYHDPPNQRKNWNNLRAKFQMDYFPKPNRHLQQPVENIQWKTENGHWIIFLTLSSCFTSVPWTNLRRESSGVPLFLLFSVSALSRSVICSVLCFVISSTFDAPKT